MFGSGASVSHKIGPRGLSPRNISSSGHLPSITVSQKEGVVSYSNNTMYISTTLICYRVLSGRLNNHQFLFRCYGGRRGICGGHSPSAIVHASVVCLADVDPALTAVHPRLAALERRRPDPTSAGIVGLFRLIHAHARKVAAEQQEVTRRGSGCLADETGAQEERYCACTQCEQTPANLKQRSYLAGEYSLKLRQA